MSHHKCVPFDGGSAESLDEAHRTQWRKDLLMVEGESEGGLDPGRLERDTMQKPQGAGIHYHTTVTRGIPSTSSMGFGAGVGGRVSIMLKTSDAGDSRALDKPSPRLDNTAIPSMHHARGAGDLCWVHAGIQRVNGWSADNMEASIWVSKYSVSRFYFFS